MEQSGLGAYIEALQTDYKPELSNNEPKAKGFFSQKLQEAKPHKVSLNVSMPINGQAILNKEVIWDKKLVLMSKTDKYGTIEYANDIFIKVSGYDDYELIGSSHSIVRHPDMPKVVFKYLWMALAEGKPFCGVFKNLTKDGCFYWVVANFETKRDQNGDIVNYVSYRTALPDGAVKEVIEPFYKRLLKIEQTNGAELSEKYLEGFLEQRNQTLCEYIKEVVMQYSKDKEKKGFFTRFFGR